MDGLNIIQREIIMGSIELLMDLVLLVVFVWLLRVAFSINTAIIQFKKQTIYLERIEYLLKKVVANQEKD